MTQSHFLISAVRAVWGQPHSLVSGGLFVEPYRQLRTSDLPGIHRPHLSPVLELHVPSSNDLRAAATRRRSTNLQLISCTRFGLLRGIVHVNT